MLLRSVLLLILLAPSLVLAQSVPLQLLKESLPSSVGTSDSANTPAPALPEPAALTASWWRYFEVDGATLDSRIQTALKRLDTLSNELPAEIAAAALPHIRLIQANLQALPQARSQVKPITPTPIVYAETYSIDQVVEIARRRSSLIITVETARNELNESDTTLRTTARRIDNQLAAYLATAPSDPNRVLRGLELMADRSGLAVTEERIRVRRYELQSDEIRLNQINQELETARRRLQAREEERFQVEQQITQARQQLEQAQDQHVKEQTHALKILGDSPEDRAATRYRQQRALKAAVNEAEQEVFLINLEARQALLELLLDAEATPSPGLRARMDDRSSRLTEVSTKLNTWTADSERERGRTGDAAPSSTTAPTSTSAENSAINAIPAFVRLINQDRFQLAQDTLVAVRHLQDEMGQADLMIQLVEEQLLHREGRLRDWLARGQQALEQARTWLQGSVSASLFKVGETPVTALGLVRIVIILTIAWWISYWLRRVLIQLGERGEGDNLAAFYTISRLSHYLIIIIGFIVGLSSIGVDFTNFALVAGAVAIGIGFGLQSIVNNFVSGLILLFERSLKVGDFVELASGVQGEVREINVRFTLINTNDNVDIVVPNSELMTTKVTNWTLLEAYRRIHLPFRVRYGTDKELVRQAVLEAAENLPHTLRGIPGRSPAVWLVGFGENGYDFELVVWLTPRAVKRPQTVHAAYIWEIDTALRKYNIPIPLPQREVHKGPNWFETNQSLVETKIELPM